MVKKRAPHSVDPAEIEKNAENLPQLTFAKILNRLLEERGIDQEKMSSDLGMSTGIIHNYRHGKTEPKLSAIIKIAEYLDVDCHYLLTGISPPNIDIVKATGLSEKCIETLKTIHDVDAAASKSGAVKYEFSETINCLVEHESDFSPIVWIGRYLSVPDIKETHYISVDGEIKEQSNGSSHCQDKFSDIDRFTVESAFLQQVTAELMLLKLELNNCEFQHELHEYVNMDECK